MFDPSKTDPELGKRIQEHLKKRGVHTPTTSQLSLPDEHKMELIENYFHNIMTVMGLDLEDDSLAETPKRVAKMFVRELFWGLDPEHFPKCTTVENKMHYDEMVIEKDITVASACEHHFVTIDGKAHVAYMPKKKVLGLSKLNRIVEYFSRRPQIQERLTEQVHAALCYLLETDDVAVVIEATHFCVKMRGVEDRTSSTITSKVTGKFRDDAALKREFLGLIR